MESNVQLNFKKTIFLLTFRRIGKILFSNSDIHPQFNYCIGGIVNGLHSWAQLTEKVSFMDRKWFLFR